MNDEEILDVFGIKPVVKDVSSKITLKVKEGPGEIIGVTELDITDYDSSGIQFVDFTGLQFSEPGVYIISIIPSNVEDLEPSEFTVEVQPEEENIAQEDVEGEDEEKKEGDRPIIAQIVQPTIELDSMKFDASSSPQDNADIGSDLGNKPFLWYNGIQIRPSSISKLFLYHDGLLPKCKVIFADDLGIIESPESTPLNDTKFELFLNSGSDVLKSIHLKFKLEINQKNRSGSNTITGTLDLKNFYTEDYKSYQGTSLEVLKAVSAEFGLGFNSNISNTDDSMKWSRRGDEEEEFIEDIILHSYISDNSFLRGYIDFFWCFNYVDLEKEWNRDLSNDVALNTGGFSNIDKGKTSITSLFLTNDMSSNTGNAYFYNHKLNNNSTYQSINTGIYSESKVYDRNKKMFLKFGVDSLSSRGDDKVILKGSPGDSEEMKKNYRSVYGGKIDTDNVHKNYMYAVVQNNRNLNNLVNISVSMTLPQPNYNLYKYQKIKVVFINQKQSFTNEKINDERLSGDWMIVDISFTWLNDSLDQKLILVRKELGKTKKEQETQVTAADGEVNNSEINENPYANGDAPNSIYKVGETYTVTDRLYNEYTITIKSISENGVDVTTDIVQTSGSVNQTEEEDKIAEDSNTNTDTNTADNEGVIVYGGAGNATPGWMKKQWDLAGLSLEKRKIIFIDQYGKSVETIKSENPDIKFVALAAFSGGGPQIWKYAGDTQFKFIGLIDPSTLDSDYRYIKKKWTNTVLKFRQENWGGADYTNRVNRALTYINDNKNSEFVMNKNSIIHTDSAHMNIPLEFFREYKSQLEG